MAVTQRPLLTFEIVDVVHPNRHGTVRAHFMTVNRRISANEYMFWIKPHWYPRRRMVGMFAGNYWRITPLASDAEMLAEMGIR